MAAGYPGAVLVVRGLSHALILGGTLTTLACADSSPPAAHEADRDAGPAHPRDGGADAATDAASDECREQGDRDHDRSTSPACGGDDCDDDDETIHPGALDGAHWEEEEIPGQGTLLDLELGQDDEPRVLVATLDGLSIGQRDGGAWSLDAIGDGASGGGSLALDSADGPHVAWGEGAGDSRRVRYAERGESGWVVETIETPNITSPAAIVLDAEDQVHVLHARAQELLHSTRGPGGWTTERVTLGGNFAEADAAMGPDGALHVVFRETSPDVDPRLRYAVLLGGTWEVEPIDGTWVSTGPRIWVGPEGPIVLYDAVVVRRTADGWLSEDTGFDHAASTTLAVDRDGLVHFPSVTAGADFTLCIEHALETEDGWATEPFHAHETCGSSWEMAMAFDSIDHLHVAWSTNWGTEHLVRVPDTDGIDQDCDGHDG